MKKYLFYLTVSLSLLAAAIILITPFGCVSFTPRILLFVLIYTVALFVIFGSDIKKAEPKK